MPKENVSNRDWIEIMPAVTWRGVRFLCYHRVVKDLSCVHPRKRKYALTSEQLRQHLDYLRDRSVVVVSMKEAISLVDSGDSVKRAYVCLTFDDGYDDNFTVAWPLIKDFGYSCHFFLVSSFIGQSLPDTFGSTDYPRQYGTKDQVRAFVEEGGSIGCHTATHAILPDLMAEEAQRELIDCKNALDELSGCSNNTLSFPSGRYNDSVLQVARENGFGWSFKVGYGVLKRRRPGFAIPRTLIQGHDLREHLMCIAGVRDKRRFLSMAKRLVLHRSIR